MGQQSLSGLHTLYFYLVKVNPRAINHRYPVLLHDFSVIFWYNSGGSWGQHYALKFLLQRYGLKESMALQNHAWTFLGVALVEVPHRQRHLHDDQLWLLFLAIIRITGAFVFVGSQRICVGVVLLYHGMVSDFYFGVEFVFLLRFVFVFFWHFMFNY